MLGAGNHFKSQIAAFEPAFFNQDATEASHVFGAAAAFFGAHVEPDSRTGGQSYARGKIQNPTAVPPHGGRKDGKLPKHLRETGSKINCQKAAERGAAESCICGAGERAILRFHERFYFFEQHLAVTV